jgi:outer membrane lipoprotein-sorting protein
MLLCIAAIAGCAQRENIPTYPPMDAQHSLEIIRQRSSQVQDVSGEGALTLTDRGGRSVRLDAAVVLAPPDRARVRAWKFGQAVLDLTILPEGTWLYLPRGEDDYAEQLRFASRSATRAVRQWLGLFAGQLDEPGSSARIEGSRLVVTRSMNDQMTLRATINRDTLTPRRYALKDASGKERFSLTLDHYRVLGQTVWPSRVEGRSESGSITIEMRDVELNYAAPAAFKPPTRAERVDEP